MSIVFKVTMMEEGGSLIHEMFLDGSKNAKVVLPRAYTSDGLTWFGYEVKPIVERARPELGGDGLEIDLDDR